MNTLLFLAVGAGVMVLAVIKNNAKFHQTLSQKKASLHYLPRAISMLVITAQVSELVKVIEHISIVNVVAALFLLAIIVATKSGTESELH